MSVSWGFYDDYERFDDMYLPRYGEGDNLANQIVTATTKLVYKWYNDGDVFDNTYALEGWANDLSSYANWLYKYAAKYNPNVKNILTGISECYTESDYEDLLRDLVVELETDEFLKEMSEKPKEGSIYTCDGPFKFVDIEEDEDDWDDDSYEEEEEWD